MNMKKLFPEDKDSKKGIRVFLDKRGFYIVLILCIAIVAGTAVFVSTRNATSPNYDAEKLIPEDLDKDAAEDVAGNLNANAPIDKAASTADDKVAVNQPAKPTPTGDAKPATPGKDNKGTVKSSGSKATAKPAAKPATGSKSTAAAKKQNFIMPVFGEITFDYAQDKLVYSKTLEDWRTHEGIDIGADRGTPVKATADGVVKDVKSDPRFGILVIIEHKNGLETVYANLASADIVSPNQKVKQGEVIGSVGNTASFESAEQPHLHFEVWKDGQLVNPATYLPKQQAVKK